MEHQSGFSIIGDSISTFTGFVPAENRVYYEDPQTRITGVTDVEDTWWMRVIRHFGATLHSNNAFSGSMVAGPAFPAANSQRRIDQILTAHGIPAPDTVLVFIGLNDYGWGGSLNQMAARSAAMPQCDEAYAVPEGEIGPAQEGALREFADAYDVMLERLRETCPDAEVWCITVPPGRVSGSLRSTFAYALRGIPLADYNDAIKAAAARHGCNVADVCVCGYDYEAHDGSHPTKRGMAQFAAMIVNRMDGTPLPEDLFGPEFASQRLCDKPSCLGCEYARGVGNAWFCVCEKDLR